MADIDYRGGAGALGEGLGEQAARLAGAVSLVPWGTWAGALSSVVLLGGMGYWAVDLTMRDVREVPVIAAMEEPMRLAPADPGGTEMPHKNLALSELTSGGAASPAPDAVRLAHAPAELDVPSLAEREAALAAAETEAAAKAETLTAEAAPAGEAVAEAAAPVGPVDLSALIDATVAQVVAPGLVRSVIPRPRPASMTIQAAAPAPAPATPPVDASTLAPGTPMIQLGALQSEAVARAEWARIAGRFGDYLAGKGMVVQEGSSGDRSFWRLRAAGFEDVAEARRLCSALQAQGQSCMSVVLR